MHLTAKHLLRSLRRENVYQNEHLCRCKFTCSHSQVPKPSFFVEPISNHTYQQHLLIFLLTSPGNAGLELYLSKRQRARQPRTVPRHNARKRMPASLSGLQPKQPGRSELRECTIKMRDPGPDYREGSGGRVCFLFCCRFNHTACYEYGRGCYGVRNRRCPC